MNESSWYQVAPEDVPEDGRVSTAVLGGRSVALTRCGGRLGVRAAGSPVSASVRIRVRWARALPSARRPAGVRSTRVARASASSAGLAS